MSSGGRSSFQPPRYNPTSQSPSLNEESRGGGLAAGGVVIMRDPGLSLSLPSSREQQQQPFGLSTGFGSPVQGSLKMMRPPEHAQRPPSGLSTGGSPVPGSMSRSMGQGHLPGRPPTAQLTIFYSGMVNVYDDVPADKAQAIMLLAGSGSSWSSSSLKPPTPTSSSGRLSPNASPSPTAGITASANSHMSSPFMSSPHLASVSAHMSSPHMSSPHMSSPHMSSPSASAPAPAIAAVPQVGPVSTPLVSTSALPAGVSKPPGRPTHAELPQARKASLFRFLEKRKDRVRGKAPCMTPSSLSPFALKKDTGSCTPPRDKSPSPPNSKMGTRSPSPANSVQNLNMLSRKRSASPAQRSGLSQPTGSETSSPSRRPGTPQHKASRPNSAEEQAAPSARIQSMGQSVDIHKDWRTQQHLHAVSQEERLEETGSPAQRQ